MIPGEHLSSIAREIKRKTIYRNSGGEPTPSPRTAALLKMFLNSISNNPLLETEYKQPLRIDFGLHTLDEASATLTANSPRIGIHAISGRFLEVHPPSIILASKDLVVVTPEVDPILFPGGYLTSSIKDWEHPADWINNLHHMENVFDMSLVPTNSELQRTTHQQFRMALISCGLL